MKSYEYKIFFSDVGLAVLEIYVVRDNASCVKSPRFSLLLLNYTWKYNSLMSYIYRVETARFHHFALIEIIRRTVIHVVLNGIRKIIHKED